MPRALVTGISGQDGSYLAELLVDKGYDVHGTMRPELLARPELMPRFLQTLREKVTLHGLKLDQTERLATLVCELACDECFHLAGPSAVDSEFLGDPALFRLTVSSTKALLAAIESSGRSCRCFVAGSSEMFGRAVSSPQDEQTPFHPRSLYGLSRLAAYHIVRQFRRRTGGFACTGILYNHESPRRGRTFLPRKVSLAVARIKTGGQTRLSVGNLDAVRDWGYAPDYVEAMWLMLQQADANDYVIATGTTHRVGDLIDLAFQAVSLDSRNHVDIDPRFFRPTEVVPLCGNPERIERATGWRPRKSFRSMIGEMVAHDLAEQSAPQSRSPD
jgi:GDPmannose 4,6-dehydratase